jgi:hypothetical protein
VRKQGNRTNPPGANGFSLSPAGLVALKQDLQGDCAHDLTIAFTDQGEWQSPDPAAAPANPSGARQAFELSPPR